MAQIIILGVLVYLTILAPALLHTNQYEFIIERFQIESIFLTSFFDTSLYVSYLIGGIITALISNQLKKRKNFVLIGSILSASFYFFMTITQDYFFLILFRFLQGSFTILCWQTLMTLTLDISDNKNRGKNMGVFGIFLALAMGSGPIFGGIFAQIGVLAPYYSAVILSLCVFFITLFLLQEPKNITSSTSISKNFKIVIAKPKLIIPGIFNFVDRLHIGFILLILPLMLQLELGVEPGLRGMVLGLFATPFILLQYPIGNLSDKYGRFRFLIIGSVFTTIMLMIMGFLAQISFLVLIIGFIFLGIGNGITGPPAMALVGDVIDPAENALGMGFFNLMGNIGIIIGPLLGGFLVDSTNFIITFFLAGVIEILSLSIILIFIIWIFNHNNSFIES
ncbi:MFS transporter [Candidatus Hodarchaeum mangrovi]